MCGILFQFNSDGCDPNRFDAARDSMAHRGPDAAGSVLLQNSTVALGHRRLSIIDLSEAANQPMRYGNLWIVYNGEIYNFCELHDALETRGHTFRTHSDTEVLLAGYQEWGAALCDRLLGMFAFVIWDDDRRKAFCARDPVGQKPLYYYTDGRGFAAASELQALRMVLNTKLPVRPESIPELLYYNYIPEPNTWFAGIKALLPGHWMEVDCAAPVLQIRCSEYWTFTPDPHPPPMTEQRALDLIGQEIETAVRSHLVADVEVGTFLSGGMDSSCITAVARALSSRPIKTFCMGMGDGDANEAPRAKRTAAFLQTEHYEEYVPNADFCADPETVLELFGQPFADYSFVPTQLVARLARRHVKCVLTGDGGDEVWGGYAHYPKHVCFPPFSCRSAYDIVRSIRIRLRGLHAWRDEFNVGHVIVTPEQVKAILAPDFVQKLGDYDVTWYVRKYWRSELDPFRRAQWADIKTYLASDILVKVDRCAMRESLETRPPFLSHRLIEQVLKGLFKKWLQGRVPDEVIQARKMGFGLPPAQFPHRPDDGWDLPRCVQAGIVNKELVPRIRRFAFASWKFEMIEATLQFADVKWR